MLTPDAALSGPGTGTVLAFGTLAEPNSGAVIAN